MREDDALEKNPHVSRQALQSVHESLFGWALSRSNFDRCAAEDLMQQAYVEVLSGRARFDNKSALRTFLFGVVQNLAMSQRRQIANRLRIVRRHSGELRQDEQADDNQSDGNDALADVWRAVAKLPARQRDITELVFCREMTIEEASSVMGVTVGTGRVHYDRAKKALAISLAEFAKDIA
jgi:RNA polymerase sigma factor (sigma-70 family)